MFNERNHCTKTNSATPGRRFDAAIPIRNVARSAVAVSLLLAAPIVANAITPVRIEDSTFFPGVVTDSFGHAVAVYGDTAVVGDPFNDLDGASAGAAWVFIRNGTTWVEQARLVPSGASAGDIFGFSVDIYDDYVVVGAPWDEGAGSVKSGAAYVFKRDGTTWTEHAKLIGAATIVGDPSDSPDYGDVFGTAVAINGDIPADATNNEIWHNIFVGSPGDLHSGWIHAGSTYGFQLSADATAWVPMGKVYSDSPEYYDEFGVSVDLDGDHMIVGAHLDGDDLFGYSSDPGAVYIWVRRGMLGAWNLETRLTAGIPGVEDHFGKAVAVNAPGGVATFVVGAEDDDDLGYGSGSVYVFVGSALTFPQLAHLMASDGAAAYLFGTSVAVSDSGILVGSPGVWGTGGWRAGAIYVFDGQGASWLETEQLIASSQNGVERLGFSVAVTGKTALIGSDLADGSSSQEGAVFVYDSLKVSLFSDGFESGDTSAWSAVTP